VHNLPPMRPGNSLTWILRGVCVVVAFVALVPTGGCGGDTDDRPAKWSYIYPAIIQPSCATASCHSDFTRIAGVNFGYEDEGYYQLACRHFIAPTSPDDSEVLHLMRAQGAQRMPPDFALPEADIALISTWIAGGAPDENNTAPAVVCGP
jgi:hypothetical protein